MARFLYIVKYIINNRFIFLIQENLLKHVDIAVGKTSSKFGLSNPITLIE